MTGILSDRYGIPINIVSAEDLNEAYQKWPADPPLSDVAELLYYAEDAFDKACGIVKTRDERIKELEAELDEVRGRLIVQKEPS